MKKNVKRIILMTIIIFILCLCLWKIGVNAETLDASEVVALAQKNMEDYINNNVTSGMTDVQKMGVIGKFIGQYEYGDGTSYVDFYLYGHGSCIANASTAVYMAEYMGFKAHMRFANKDEGAGSNHYNAAILANGKLYVLEAGYSNYSPPRPYNIYRVYEDNGFSYQESKGFYQYDGYDEVVNVPQTHAGVAVNKLGEQAFARGVHSETKVKTINIGSNITTIEDGALHGPSTLTNINVDSANPNYKSINGVVYSKDGTTLVAYPTGRTDKKFTVPSGVKTIGAYAFSRNQNIEEVVLPEGLTKIGYSSFMYCENLSKINIPETVTDISGYAFYNTNFTKMTIPASVSKVGTSNNEFIRRFDGAKLEYLKFMGDPMITDSGRLYVKTIYAKANTTPQAYAEAHNIAFVELDNNKTIIEKSMISGLTSPILYGTNNNELNISIVDNGKTLVKDRDYTIAYANNTSAGVTATVTITGIGNYYGEVQYSYRINKLQFESSIKSNEIRLTNKKLEAQTNLKEGETYTIFYYSSPTASYGSSSLSLPSDVKDGDMIDLYYKVIPDNDYYEYDNSIKTITVKIIDDRPIAVESVTLSKTSATLLVGETTTVTATILPTNATNKTINWISYNPSIATWENGVIKAVGTGDTTISAQSSNGLVGKMSLSVRAEVEGVRVNTAYKTLSVGESAQILATVYPSDAINTTITWTSSNPNVVSVDNGTITALKEGTSVITAKSYNGKTTTTTVEVKIKQVVATGITLNKTSTTLNVGASETLTATISPTNVTNKTITWTSSNPSVASVSNGKITALQAGKTNIVARTSNGKMATCAVTINAVTINPTGITLSKTSTTIKAGASETITATVLPSNATNKTVTWTTSNASVATVSGGKITGVKAGTATITAKTSNGKTATCAVTVQASTVVPTTINPTGITLSKTSTTIKVGANETITATVLPSNATNKTVTWTTSNASVATVSGGKITAIKAGTATITAKTSNGKTATCKVTVQNKESEPVVVKVPNVAYRTHVQNIGWQTYVRDGAMSGTSGQSLRLEAIKIRLTGELANHYDIYYRVHCQDIGWMNWAKNGESAGSAGYSYRLEGIEIVIVEKGKNPPARTNIQYNKPFKCHTISYRTHVQNIGWQDYVYDGAMSGTSGQSLRLEGINIKLENQLYSGDIEYCTHVQNIGWQNFVKNGAMSGTSGRSLRLEAIKIRLTGEMAKKYDIYYRVHCQNIGWMGWAKNGESAGTAGFSYRLEGINIMLVEKGNAAPGSTANHFQQK